MITPNTENGAISTTTLRSMRSRLDEAAAIARPQKAARWTASQGGR